MSATRTQVYLTADQRRQIDRITATEGSTLAEVVRRALDAYLSEAVPDATQVLASTWGALPDLAPPDRGEWERTGSDG